MSPNRCPISYYYHYCCSLDAAKAGKPLPDEDLTKEVYSTADHKSEPVDFIRMPDYHKSIGTKL